MKSVFHLTRLQKGHPHAGNLTKGLLAFLVMFSMLWGSFTPASAQSTPPGLQNPDEVSAFIDGVMASEMETNHVPGAVVVVVKDGEEFFARGYGFADLDLSTPVDPATTLFRPGSVSKLFTWTAVMQLVEQGKLSLDEDVNTYLDFKIPTTFAEPITLKNLMTHTPGFEDRGDGLFKLKSEDVSSLETYLKSNLPARVFAPGKIGAYSNYGTALAGYIVQRVSGMPYLDYTEQNILTPLGMSHATFRQPLPENLAADMSGAYRYVNGGYVKGIFEYVVGYPAGGLSASGLDMAKFMIAHLQNGRYGDAQILKEETARQMHSPLYTPDPRMGGMAYGFFENTINGQYMISHGGDTLLFHSILFLLPEQNVGVFISTNGSTGEKAVSGFEKAFMDHYYPMTKRDALQPTADFTSRASKYAGTYFLARSSFTTFEKTLSVGSPVVIQVDAQNHVLATVMGDTVQYVEVQPGLLENPKQPGDRLVLKEENGQIYLHPVAPFVFIKAPWYRSALLHGLILGGGALLFLGTIIAWLLSFFRGLAKREKRPVLARLARWTGAGFGIGFGMMMGMVAGTFMNINPAFGVPNLFFGMPAGFDSLMKVPWVLAALAVLMLVFAVLAWVKRYWTSRARLGYTLLTLWSFAILWSMVYWNILK